MVRAERGSHPPALLVFLRVAHRNPLPRLHGRWRDAGRGGSELWLLAEGDGLLVADTWWRRKSDRRVNWRRFLVAGGHGSEVIERRTDVVRQVSLRGFLNPGFECDLEGRDADFGGQTGGWI
jgi:hypothetical protein